MTTQSQHRSRLTREALVEAIQPRNGYTPTLAEIGAEFGVTRQRVSQVLQEVGLRKRRREARCCVSCKKYLDARPRKYKGLCFACSPVILVRLLCGQCGTHFELSTTQFYHRARRRKGTMPFFCNRRCQGLWVGDHFGFTAHPENTGKKPFLYPGVGSYYQRKKALGICAWGGCHEHASPRHVYCEHHLAWFRSFSRKYQGRLQSPP